MEFDRADVLELDVQLTRDGQFVAWHGPNLDNVRIWGKISNRVVHNRATGVSDQVKEHERSRS